MPSQLIHKHVSAVFQDFNHYYLSIGENIGISEISCIEDTNLINEALEKLGHSDFIDLLPDGIDTILGKEIGGTELSGGQWQQLAIARGYFRNSNLIVLDEPTSTLDPLREASIYNDFKKLCKGKIGIIITHRLGAARLADKIFLLEKGRIIEQGSHSELCDLCGKYWDMYKSQAGMYTDIK